MFCFTCTQNVYALIVVSAPAVGRVLLQLQADYHQKILICSYLCGPSSVVPENKTKSSNVAFGDK